MNNNYASHLILLAALGRSSIGYEVIRIAELGCGLYSTPMWLNKNIWPRVESVISHEHNLAFSRFIHYITNDQRLTIAAHFPITADNADLVFIDNGDDRQERTQGIQHVIDSCSAGLVILHDANEHEYMQLIEPYFENCIVYTGAYPHTAVLWNGDRWDYEEIKASMKVAEVYECLQLT